MEKISETHIRKALVDKIKETGLKEIEDLKFRLKEQIADLDLKEKRDCEHFDHIVLNLTALNYLKSYLMREEAMFDYTDAYEDLDKIYYTIHLKTLEIWLESGIVNKYLTHVLANGIIPVPLTDGFFGFRSDFISLIESVIYDEKKSKGEKESG